MLPLDEIRQTEHAGVGVVVIGVLSVHREQVDASDRGPRPWLRSSEAEEIRSRSQRSSHVKEQLDVKQQVTEAQPRGGGRTRVRRSITELEGRYYQDSDVLIERCGPLRTGR